MNIVTCKTAGLLLAVMAVAGCSHLHADHNSQHQNHAGHDTGHDSSEALVLNEGRKWNTDASLRTGMQNIRELTAPWLVSGQTPDPVQASVVAAGIQAQVTYIASQCKLEPKADAALHVLIADLLQGAETLAAEPTSVQAMTQIRHALVQYPHYFDHPGWMPVPAAE